MSRTGIEVAIDTEKNLITRTVFGLVSTEEIVANIKATLAHPDYRPGMKSLTDLRQATPHAGSVDIRAIARLITEQGDGLRGGKAAVVVSAAVSFGMMRMLQAYADQSPLEIEVFQDIAQARRWLELVD